MTLIKHLQAPDDFTGFYLIKELEVKQTNTTPAKDFMDIVLCDASGKYQPKCGMSASLIKRPFSR